MVFFSCGSREGHGRYCFVSCGTATTWESAGGDVSAALLKRALAMGFMMKGT